ncbi:MAG: haloacid dehalogenase-like hydrolase [Bdellovibrionaceae bacterium]|nr:haloacid dehalogenase-like hydrolase [Pseudobdellovibrionaceae bacterium]MBX3033989.1 haloacid dehalogenase-like hydrolase [Pseudobdellovibrionaceae bacterium]
MKQRVCSILFLSVLVFSLLAGAATDPLPSWAAGSRKDRLVRFVESVSTPTEDHYVAESERIAVFDNDGTLWVEHPVPTEIVFTFDRVRALAPRHPEWAQKPPFQAVLNDDRAAMSRFTLRDFAILLGATHGGMTSGEFREIARVWLKTAKHPRYQKLYTECVYQPQLELLRFLRSKGFKTYIVSGGEVEFMRAFAEEVYGVPPEQVIGTSMKTVYQLKPDLDAVLNRQEEISSINDGPGKPVNIDLQIGRHPLLAFGNSNGDQQMLEHSASQTRPSLQLLLHHDDGVREYAYDRDTSNGRLSTAMDEALRRNWVLVSFKEDFKTVFPPARPSGSSAKPAPPAKR